MLSWLSAKMSRLAAGTPAQPSPAKPSPAAGQSGPAAGAREERRRRDSSADEAFSGTWAVSSKQDCHLTGR